MTNESIDLSGQQIANASAVDRSKTDFYPTPENVTRALLEHLGFCGVIWEPAAGEGHMTEVMRKMGNEVIATELHDREYGETGIDFLTAPLRECDWIITNPPFSLAEKFIRRCIEHEKPFAMLLKSQYWHSSRRLKLFEEYAPEQVCPLTWRPDFLFGAKSGSTTMECVWTVWGKQAAKHTLYVPLRKPDNG